MAGKNNQFKEKKEEEYNLINRHFLLMVENHSQGNFNSFENLSDKVGI